VAIAMEGVQVRVAGHTVLTGIDLTIAPGSHVAIVGPSGAGKSSLVGTLLGWHRPATGAIRVGGSPLDSRSLAQVRRETAWVDQAQLWTLPSTICLRCQPTSLPVGGHHRARLHSVMTLPDGLRTAGRGA
jgi:ATP-binding cassette subfamily B protein